VLKRGASAEKTTLVLLHGTGGDENGLMELGAALDSEANLLGVRGRSREEGLNRFFRRYAEGVFDEHDIMLQAEALSRFLEQARSHYELSGPMIAVGYSNGANMAAAMLLLVPDVFDGAILLRAMMPLSLPALPNLEGVSVLMLNGETDPLAPIESAKELAESLREAGAKVTHRLTPTGHNLGQADIQLALAWLAEGLAGQERVAKGE
jgi:phospholipase/carboxylesterase